MQTVFGIQGDTACMRRGLHYGWQSGGITIGRLRSRNLGSRIDLVVTEDVAKMIYCNLRSATGCKVNQRLKQKLDGCERPRKAV